jgi:RND family efflux transporter MFP subunit
MNRSMIRTLAAAVVLGGLAAALAGCSPHSKQPQAPRVVSGLAVATAGLDQTPDGATAVGTVHARESASLAAQVPGRVTAVLVHEGDAVRAGQVLVRLDGAVARADAGRAHAGVAASEHEVAVAQSQSALASSTLVRYQVLREKKSISPQEFDEVDRRAQSASAQLEAARAQLDAARSAATAASASAGYSTITAPFAGVVTGRLVDPGAMAMPGTPLVDVDRGGPLEIDVTVDESKLRDVKLGAQIAVEIPSLAAPRVQGRVEQIVPAADSASHTFLVKIGLPSTSDLRAGMYGTATMGGGGRTALMIPLAAVVAHGSMNSVWVLDQNGIASLRYVTLGSARGDRVEILSGLSSGERVVLAPGDRELGGARIEVRP